MAELEKLPGAREAVLAEQALASAVAGLEREAQLKAAELKGRGPVHYLKSFYKTSDDDNWNGEVILCRGSATNAAVHISHTVRVALLDGTWPYTHTGK